MPGKVDMSRSELLSSIRGQRVKIPDLNKELFHGWPQATNSRHARLQVVVDQTLEELFTHGGRLQKMRAADVAYFTGAWWPYAEFDELCTAAYLSIWLFAWDDETDSLEFNNLSEDFEAAQVFRDETIRYIRQCLNPNSPAQSKFTPSSRFILNFKPVGDAISASCDDAQREAFLQQLELFVSSTELEQRYQLSGDLPSVEDYMKRRMGSSAVGVCLAIQEYTLGIKLTSTVREDPDMHALWEHTNIIISCTNDMLSIKKEIAQSQLDSLIPLLYHRHRSLQTAMDEAFGMLQRSKMELDAAAARLLDSYAPQQDAMLHDGVNRFIEACRYACMANLNWSVASGRYKLGVKSLQGGLDVVI